MGGTLGQRPFFITPVIITYAVASTSAKSAAIWVMTRITRGAIGPSWRAHGDKRLLGLDDDSRFLPCEEGEEVIVIDETTGRKIVWNRKELG